MPYTLETDTITNVDISSRASIGSYTAAADGLVIVDLMMKGLNGAAAVFTIDATINDGTDSYQGPRFSDTKRLAADTTFARPVAFTLSVSSGDVITIYAESSNASDNSADGSVIFRDGLHQESVDVASIDGQTAAATNLKNMLAGSGGHLNLVASTDQPALKITSASGSEPAVEITNSEDQSVAMLIQNHGGQGTALRIRSTDTQGQAISLDSDDDRGIFGLKVDVDKISGDSAAADAIEAAFDGTGANICNADGSTVAERIAAVKAETANIRQDTQIDMPAQITALNDLSTADIDARLLAYDSPTKAELDAALNVIKGATFDTSTDSLEAIRNQGDAAWTTGAGSSLTAADVTADIDANSTQLAAIKAKTDTITSGGGDGDTVVNHDTGGVDNLRSVDGSGNGLDNVTIRAYLKSEYDADATTATLRATAVTGTDGRWVNPMMLNSGLTHTLVSSRTGMDTHTQELTVP